MVSLGTNQVPVFTRGFYPSQTWSNAHLFRHPEANSRKLSQPIGEFHTINHYNPIPSLILPAFFPFSLFRFFPATRAARTRCDKNERRSCSLFIAEFTRPLLKIGGGLPLWVSSCANLPVRYSFRNKRRIAGRALDEAVHPRLIYRITIRYATVSGIRYRLPDKMIDKFRNYSFAIASVSIT